MFMSINQRRYQRFAFTDWAWGRVVHEYDFNNEPKMYKLVDLSQGGVSLVTNNLHDFKKGTRFMLTSIEGRSLQKNILVVVRYVNQLDEGEGGYRVGCQFLEIKEKTPFIRGYSSYGFQTT
jgi:c-di-GMP-binding flagellar brake protein YcgR